MNNNYGLIPSRTKNEIKEEYLLLLNDNTEEVAIYKMCEKYNLYYDEDIDCKGEGIGYYLRIITSLPQYRGMTFENKKVKNKELSVVDILKKDRSFIIKKMEKALEQDNIGTYNNLTKSLILVSDLINKEDVKWEMKWSKYATEGRKELAIWEQCGDEIRNNRRFLIEKEIEKNTDNTAYFDFSDTDVVFYYKNSIYRIRGQYDEIAQHMDKIVFKGDKSIKIYGDTFSFGRGVADALEILGYSIYSTEINATDYKAGMVDGKLTRSVTTSRELGNYRNEKSV